MISDVLFDAIQQIEEWQKESPAGYEARRHHIDLVKKVMASLQETLDEPPFAYGLWYERLLNTDLTEDQKRYWRVCCEAGIARWAERPRLLEPVSPEDLLDKLHDAVDRQEAMLNKPTSDEEGVHQR